MSGVVRLTAEWALFGKDSGAGGDYGIIAGSRGEFSRDEFHDILFRWSPGQVSPPEVTISCLRVDDEGAYIGLAVHGWSNRRDHEGRPVALTSYYCVPYSMLQDTPVSYEALYAAVATCAPVGEDPVVLTVPVLDEPQLAAIAARAGDTAKAAAALLLTEEQICVLGGENLHVLDRLRYLDTVAALLPYGVRTRLTASTWTDSATSHRIKLSFAKNAKRDAFPLHWNTTAGRPWSQTTREYYDALVRRPPVTVVRALAAATKPVGFRHAFDVAEAVLEGVPATGDILDVPALPGPPAPPELPAVPENPATIEDLLHRCAAALNTRDYGELGLAAAGLKALADAREPSRHDRARHRQIIETRVLPAAAAGPRGPDGAFYELILRLGYGHALTSADLDSITRAALPSADLYAAMARMPLDDDLVQVRVAVRAPESSLAHMVERTAISLLIPVAAHEPSDPEVVRYLRDRVTRHADRLTGNAEIARVLEEHVFLSAAVAAAYPGDPETQANVLDEFLHIAYGPSPADDRLGAIAARAVEPHIAMLLVAAASTRARRTRPRALWQALRGRAGLLRRPAPGAEPGGPGAAGPAVAVDAPISDTAPTRSFLRTRRRHGGPPVLPSAADEHRRVARVELARFLVIMVPGAVLALAVLYLVIGR
ncbi:hypothetical protein Ssi03_60910 [Sphaerisporangium siamense]|uniref:Uncharacterized protein n=1 Tax=Sphaerisporangium siamense TaxID=795645 RepID=A0A7W7DAL7_9ACTN|nr:hypothetical protein [Sphaerisporangium siamense]MBB4703322.1 hypothetical protein [Sphaerisporangium siamense]GII88101.1 hypothetical protein Ssi03_60910 [Sphaerisporangium siamense]